MTSIKAEDFYVSNLVVRLQKATMFDKDLPRDAAQKLLEQYHRIEQLEAARDSAYTERNRLVAFLASIYPSGVKKTAIPGWDEAWHGCVYIDLPNGQASWHYHDSEAHLFAHLPPYQGDWDGHSTEEKYARIAALAGEKKDE